MSDVRFNIVLRGYERRQVEALVERALAGEDVRHEVKRLTTVLRRYDRREVEEFFESRTA